MPRKLSTEEAKRIAKIRLQKMTPEQLKAHALYMNEKRYGTLKKKGENTKAP